MACYLNKWVVNAGIMATHVSGNDSEWYFFPGTDLSYQLLQPLKLVASWNRSLRMPTFTDLYYSGPTNAGNPDLKPEKSEALEGGLKWSVQNLEGHLIVFHRKGENMIDWVKKPGDERWQSMNHTEINSSGAELNLSYQPVKNTQGKGFSKFQVSYLYNKLSKRESSLISHYALDNLRHKLTVTINRSFLKNASAGLLLVYQDRAGTYPAYLNGKSAGEVSYTPFWLADIKLTYRIRSFRFFILANDLFNQEYFDLGNVPQPGRWIKSGVAIDLEFDQNRKI